MPDIWRQEIVVPVSERANTQTLVTTYLFHSSVYAPNYWNILFTQIYLSTYKDTPYYVMHGMDFVQIEVVILS